MVLVFVLWPFECTILKFYNLLSLLLFSFSEKLLGLEVHMCFLLFCPFFSLFSLAETSSLYDFHSYFQLTPLFSSKGNWQKRQFYLVSSIATSRKSSVVIVWFQIMNSNHSKDLFNSLPIHSENSRKKSFVIAYHGNETFILLLSC